MPTATALIHIAEDHRDTREMYAEYLHYAGYTIIEATSGERALRIVELLVPDVVVTDVYLPGFNGLDLVRRVKTDGRMKRTRVVIISGHGDSTKRQAADAGCDVYLMKPCSPAQLADEIERLRRTT